MKALLKITEKHIRKLYRGIDYVENYEKISFADGTILYKKNLNTIIDNIVYSYDNKHKYVFQRQIKKGA